MKCLDDKLLRRLRTNRDSLTEMIDLDGGLLIELLAAGCITMRQRCSIEAAGDAVKMNSRLLQMITCKSKANFNKFLKCLADTKQHHIVGMLLKEDAGMSSDSLLAFLRFITLWLDCL